MLDVSDGLLGDLAHILERSGTGAIVDTAALPLSPLIDIGAPPGLARRCLLAGGDDYELLFSAPASAHGAIAALADHLDLPFSRIGTITANTGALLLRDADGRTAPANPAGYDHFAPRTER
jgi:thiamine-monophosphate kinase